MTKLHLGDLSPDLDFGLKFYQQNGKSMVLDLADFIKPLKVHEIAKSVDLTLSLEGSGLKFCKEDLNIPTINFYPLQNLKWL